jgi:MFS family permease
VPPAIELPAPQHVDVARVQRSTIRLLFATQVIGGVGVGIGGTVGALLAADMGGAGISGLAASAGVVGAALLAVPATRLMRTGGRRSGLAFAYLVAVLGSAVVVAGATFDRLAAVLAGMFLFGGATTANLQARYAAVDLAEPQRRGRQLSFVVWATTVGAVAAPNLAPLADRTLRAWRLREYAGPFVFSALAFLLAALLILTLLRPDPLLVARGRTRAAGAAPLPAADPPTLAPAAPGGGLSATWRAVVSSRAARLGMAAVAVGHVVMVGVMSMTPVHIGRGGHHHDAVLSIVGVVLSLHIAGMYALSPVAGWLTDRLGRRPVILLGVGLLIVACAVAGLASHHIGPLTAGLFLLGIGWSATMVAGSTLLSESVDARVRPAAQGLSDLVMGLAGAGAAGLAGLVVHLGGYGALALLSALATVPLVVLALRPGGQGGVQRT